MTFVHSPMQMRLFKPPPHYQLLCSREELNSEFWKEIAVAFVKQKYNVEILWNEYSISMYQGKPPHKPYFITTNNWEQENIGPNKKIVVTHVVGELEVLI